MTTRRWRLARPCTSGLLCAVLACRGTADRTPSNDTAASAPSAPGAAAVSTTPPAAWPAALGGLLVVAGPNERRGVLLLPDSAPDSEALAAARGAALQLVTAAGAVGRATIAGVERADSSECIAWPVARLQFGTDSSGREWTLGLRDGAGAPLPRGDLATLGGRDSTRLVVDLVRLASGLAGDTNPAFRGLPMIVRMATRFRTPGGAEVVVAEVVRRVGQEAKPLEERVAFVAERDSVAAPWRAGWIARVDGLEETIEAVDVVGTLALADASLVVVLQRESQRGVRYELLERGRDGWTRRWIGPWSGC